LRELVEVGAGLPNFPERILQAMADAPLSRSEILGAAIPTSVICGIYFLIKRDRIVYVGQSKNVLRRIARHIDDGREFDRFTISPCKEEDLDRMEATYISALYPDQNVMLGKAA
ncbi:MAG: GIY-YIG nuclease family protein, partial [Pseudomonadota bacterium]